MDKSWIKAVKKIISVFGCSACLASAHDIKVGAIRIDHPYATPSLSGATGAVYFKSIRNDGNTVDQLIGARTTASESVEIHEMTMEGEVMKMRALSQVNLPVGKAVSFKHGQANGYHLMLIGLKKSLKDGDRFPVWLQFKQAGEAEVMVWVQTPRSSTSSIEHKH